MLRADMLVLDALIACGEGRRRTGNDRVHTRAQHETPARQRTTQAERHRNLVAGRDRDRAYRAVDAKAARCQQTHGDRPIYRTVRRDAHHHRAIHRRIGTDVARRSTIDRQRHTRCEHHRRVELTTHLVDAAINDRRLELHGNAVDQCRHRGLGATTARLVVDQRGRFDEHVADPCHRLHHRIAEHRDGVIGAATNPPRRRARVGGQRQCRDIRFAGCNAVAWRLDRSTRREHRHARHATAAIRHAQRDGRGIAFRDDLARHRRLQQKPADGGTELLQLRVRACRAHDEIRIGRRE